MQENHSGELVLYRERAQANCNSRAVLGDCVEPCLQPEGRSMRFFRMLWWSPRSQVPEVAISVPPLGEPATWCPQQTSCTTASAPGSPRALRRTQSIARQRCKPLPPSISSAAASKAYGLPPSPCRRTLDCCTLQQKKPTARSRDGVNNCLVQFLSTRVTAGVVFNELCLRQCFVHLSWVATKPSCLH